MKYFTIILFSTFILASIVFTLIPWFARFTWIHAGSHVIRFDYVFHFVMNGMLMLSFYYWSKDKWDYSIKQALLFITLGVTFCFIIELIQTLLPKRSFSFGDLFFSTMGIFVGTLNFWLVKRFLPGIIKTK